MHYVLYILESIQKVVISLEFTICFVKYICCSFHSILTLLFSLWFFEYLYVYVLPSIRKIIRIYITITICIDFVINPALLEKAFYLPWQFAS